MTAARAMPLRASAVLSALALLHMVTRPVAALKSQTAVRAMARRATVVGSELARFLTEGDADANGGAAVVGSSSAESAAAGVLYLAAPRAGNVTSEPTHTKTGVLFAYYISW